MKMQLIVLYNRANIFIKRNKLLTPTMDYFALDKLLIKRLKILEKKMKSNKYSI